MPELPEVETVRGGLQRHVSGRTFANVQVLHPRAARRHLAGPDDLAAVLRGGTVGDVRRRGKYLWLTGRRGRAARPPGDERAAARRRSADAPLDAARAGQVLFTDGGPDLRFVDQRTFGHLTFSPGGAELPAAIAHIAPDPLEPAFDDEPFAARLRTRRTGIKRALLDQSLISGVGNIYADESLWRARLHWARGHRRAAARRRGSAAGARSERCSARRSARAVPRSTACTSRSTGESGYFDRSLAVYGREGEPCPRCGTPVTAREVHEQVLVPLSPLPAQATARALVTSHDDWDVEPVPVTTSVPAR